MDFWFVHGVLFYYQITIQKEEKEYSLDINFPILITNSSTVIIKWLKDSNTI